MSKDFRQISYVLLLFSILWTASLLAQNPRGSLRGTVQDATGARIASAQIVARLVGSNFQRQAASEDRGEFRLDDLGPGDYHITISAAGFAPAAADVVISVATVRDISVTMKVSLTQEVQVQAEVPSITSEIIDLASAVH